MNIKAFAYNGQTINQREDGFLSLTQMCQANGKLLGDWQRAKSTKAYIQEMIDDMGISISEILEVYKGGNPKLQGTWGHPELAIHLAQWISPKFHRWCNAHIFNLMTSGKTSLDIDPLEEMRLKIEYERLKGQNLHSEFALNQFRHTIVTTCPEPVQQKILGYQVVKEVEKVEVVVDKRTGQEYDGVGITYVAKALGMKNNECWAWLEQNGYGKDSGKWHNELTAISTPKLSRDDLQYLKEIYTEQKQGRQLFLGE